MADYWLAPALEVFRAELNAAFPNRDKRSDGWIGDKYHASRNSKHNPADWATKGTWTGVVLAYDADNDIVPGGNAQSIVDHLASQLGKLPALGPGAELIYNGRIITTDRLREGWRKYSGTNPHTGHFHLSVGRSAAAYNSDAPWGISTGDDDMSVLGPDPGAFIRDRCDEAVERALTRAFKDFTGHQADLRTRIGYIDQRTAGDSKVLASLASRPVGDVDTKALAAELREVLGDVVADELAERLKS